MITNILNTETLSDIAYYAGYNKFTTGDSRDDVSQFRYWATLFESEYRNTNWDEVDYLLVIEEFAQKQIDDYYNAYSSSTLV